MPTLSVVLPNYNHGRYLPKALAAILQQSHRALEVLVIDDGSQDDSLEIIRAIERTDPSVRLIRNERNLGVIPTCNRGINEAVGDFVYSVGADDVVLPGFFEKALGLLARHPHAKVCVAEMVQFDAATGRTRMLRPGLSSVAGYLDRAQVVQRMARSRVYLFGGMSIVARSAYLELGGFSEELKWYADWFLLVVLALRHGACYLPEPLTTLRMSRSAYNVTGRQDKSAQARIVPTIFDRFLSEEYSDIALAVRESDALCLLGSQILPLLAQPKYRSLASPRLLARLLGNVPVTALGLNPTVHSPLRGLDRAVRDALHLDAHIQDFGVSLHPADA